MLELDTWQNLEHFIICDHQLTNGVGWFYMEKVLVYYNIGYEHFYSIPDWEKLRLEIIEHYNWVKTKNDIYLAFQDAVSDYSLYSRG